MSKCPSWKKKNSVESNQTVIDPFIYHMYNIFTISFCPFHKP